MITQIKCTQNDGHCETCSLCNYGMNCENHPVAECFKLSKSEMRDGPGQTREIGVFHLTGSELDVMRNPQKYFGPDGGQVGHFCADEFTYAVSDEEVGTVRVIGNSNRLYC